MLNVRDLIRYLARDEMVDAALHAEAVGRASQATRLLSRQIAEVEYLKARIEAEHEQLGRLAASLERSLEKLKGAVDDRDIPFERSALREAAEVVGGILTLATPPLAVVAGGQASAGEGNDA